MALLSLDEVSAGYGRRAVLDRVSLSIEAGERVALIGPNGAGKTTLLRVAGGVLAPTSGRVRVGDVDLSTLSARAAARRLSGVAQQEGSEFDFTVREVVTLGRTARLRPWAAPSADDLAAVDAAIERLDLVAVADRPVPSLSGGERRRASLARCLAQDADVLLLDEPTAHLDLGHEVDLLSALSRLAKERGKAVVAALHDVNLAALFADRIVLLVDGRVAFHGTPAQALTPARIREAFRAQAHVLAHPRTGGPVVVPEGL